MLDACLRPVFGDIVKDNRRFRVPCWHNCRYVYSEYPIFRKVIDIYGDVIAVNLAADFHPFLLHFVIVEYDCLLIVL
ncbi:hypothetical protein D3C85_1598360 [compost metagenome]